MLTTQNRSTLRAVWPLAIVIALLYLLLAHIGLALALPPGYATAFWPSSGLSVAAILIYGYTIWPGIFVGSFLANLLVSTDDFTTSISLCLAIASGSTLQALAIGYLLRTFTNSTAHLLNTRRNVFLFITYTLFCSTISSSVSLLALWSLGVVSGSPFFANWLTWWIGDLIGVYVFTPCLYSWLQPQLFKWIPNRIVELILLVALTSAISLLCFGNFFDENYPIAYMLIPNLIWAAFRFPPQIATTLIVLISGIAIMGTTYGLGAPLKGYSNTSLLLVQAFIGVITTTTLVLISAVNEIRHNQALLEEYSQELKLQLKLLQRREKHSGKSSHYK